MQWIVVHAARSPRVLQRLTMYDLAQALMPLDPQLPYSLADFRYNFMHIMYRTFDMHVSFSLCL